MQFKYGARLETPTPSAPRDGAWIQTYTGRQFWPLDPRPEDVDAEDIAHALSQLCRYTGHSKFVVSVAEHCCHVHDLAHPHLRPYALLHDAAEAYIADVSRPIKGRLYVDGTDRQRRIDTVESEVVAAIFEKFGLRQPTQLEVREVEILDLAVLAAERLQVFDKVLPWEGLPPAACITVNFWPAPKAEAEFMGRLAALPKERRR